MENLRFKFRVVYYNDVEKKYFIFEPDLISADGTARAYAYGESGADEYYDTVTLNQCTGLKDKNGKLIYEGDIVRFYSLYGHVTFEIKWSEEFATFGYEDDETDFSELGRLYDEAAFVEVLGNIYENPELLKKEDW